MTVNNLNFDYVNSTVATAVQNAEASLKAKIAAIDTSNTSATDLLILQQEVSKWTIMTQIQSTLVKEVSDAMKGVIQKAG